MKVLQLVMIQLIEQYFIFIMGIMMMIIIGYLKIMVIYWECYLGIVYQLVKVKKEVIRKNKKFVY